MLSARTIAALLNSRDSVASAVPPPSTATSVPRSLETSAAVAELCRKLDGLPLASIYALLAAAYSLVYALIGRINFAFGEIAAAGGYAAAIAALAMVGWAPAPLLIAVFVLAAVLPWQFFASALSESIPICVGRSKATESPACPLLKR